MGAVVGGNKVFAYEAQTAEGGTFKGTLEAASAADVQARLSSLALQVLSVVPANVDGKGKGRGGAGLGADDFLAFNQQLAYLTEAGLPVERGLRLIAVDLKSGRLSRAANEVAAELERGVPLEQAFAQYASRFPPLYGKLVEAGASAGNLPGILFNLGRHLELVGRLRKAVWRTLSYPLMVLAGLSLVLLFMSMILLPRFETLYHSAFLEDFGEYGRRLEIPLATRWLIAFSHVYPWVFCVGWGMVAALVLLQAGARILGRRGIRWDAITMRVPLIGSVLQANLLARWIDALRLGVEAGLDLPRAIALAAEATGAWQGRLGHDARGLSELIERGQPAGTFQGRLIPATVPAALELASHSGDLPAALMTLSRMYEQHAEHRLQMLPSVLTPMLVVVVGAGIGFCVTGMFLPVLNYIKWVTSW